MSQLENRWIGTGQIDNRTLNNDSTFNMAGLVLDHGVNPNLYVGGDSTLSGYLHVGGDSTLAGALLVDGTASFLSAISLANPSVTGNMYVAGNIGVGTTSPALPLSVVGNPIGTIRMQTSPGTAPRLDIVQVGIKQWGIVNPASTTRLSIIEDGADERVTFLSGGNVGIGTASPISAMLAVTGSGVYGSAGGELDTRLRVLGAGTTSSTYGLKVHNSNGNNYALVVRDDGNVGIGTNPSYPLHVNYEAGAGGSTVDVLGIFTNGTPNQNTGPRILFGATNPLGGISVIQNINGTPNGKMVFMTRNYADGFIDRMVIDHNGNVGIGTTSPVYPLHINNTTANMMLNSTTGTNYAYIDFQNTGGVLEIGLDSSTGEGLAVGTSAYAAVIAHHGNYPLQFATNDSVKMTILSSGNVGIGTAFPSTALDVNGQIKIRGGSPSAGYILTSDANGLATWGVNSPSSGGGWSRSAPYVHTTTLTDNVGIGTASPAYLLDMAKSVNDVLLRITGGTGGATITKISSDNDRTIFGTSSNDALQLVTNDIERLAITAAGNVGIGTASPSTILHVKGNNAILSLSVDGAAPNQTSRLHMNAAMPSSNNDRETAEIVTGYTADTYVSSYMRFRTLNSSTVLTDVMTITNGNVGIGTTNPTDQLQIGANTTIRSISNASNFGNNVYWDGANYRYINSAASSLLQMGSGVFVFYTAVSDISGNILQNINRMTILNNGNVGIGTANPGTKLEVIATGGGDGIWVRDSNANYRATMGVTSGYGFSELWNSSNVRTVQVSSNGTSYFNGGNVGIGTTNPSGWDSAANNLVVGDTDGSDKGISIVTTLNQTGSLYFASNAPTTGKYRGFIKYIHFPSVERMAFGVTGTECLTIKYNGNVGVCNSNPGYVLDVAGQCHASGFPTSSDSRFKENVVEISGALDKVLAMRGVTFNWTDNYPANKEFIRVDGSKVRQLGLIAQEVEKVVPEIVTTWQATLKDGTILNDARAVDYGRLVPVLVGAIKELESRLQTVEADNVDLKKRLEALEAKIS